MNRSRRPDPAARQPATSPPGRVAVLAATLLLAAGCMHAGRNDTTAPAPSPAPAPGQRQPLAIGLPVNPAELDRPGLERAVGLARRAGATELGAGVAWWYVTLGQQPGHYDWRPLDRLVDIAHAHGMRVRLQLSGTPDWVHPGLARTVPEQSERMWYPPRTPAELRAWGRFVGDTVRHFAGRVSSYELWNEPDLHYYWKPTPSPAEFVRLLAEGYRSAKQASATATVVFGGLCRSNIGYLQQYYAQARRLFPDAAQHRYFFDMLNVHPYTDGRSPDQTPPDAVQEGQFGDIDHSFAGMRQMKALMDYQEGRSGTAGKQLVIGEYGFTVGPAASQPIVPDRRRAYFLKRAVADTRQLHYVAALFWYAFLPDSTVAPGWEIVHADGSPTATFLALQDLAAARGPTVRFADRTALRPGGPPIRPALTGLRPADIAHTELYIDGVLAAEADGATVRWTSGSVASAAGQAQLVVYTRDGHAWPSELVQAGTGPP